MSFTAESQKFRFDDDLAAGVTGKRVLITGAGKDGGLGQAFALAAGLNGAASVAVHFHQSYGDGFDLVTALRKEEVNAFPVQADVTNLGDLWASRTYVIEQMGGLPPKHHGKLLYCQLRYFDPAKRRAGLPEEHQNALSSTLTFPRPQ